MKLGEVGTSGWQNRLVEPHILLISQDHLHTLPLFPTMGQLRDTHLLSLED